MTKSRLNLEAILEPTLARAHAFDAFRCLKAFQTENIPSPSTLMLKDEAGRALHHFSSNDYLGFSQVDALKTASIEAIQHYGTGINSSRLVSGQHPLHEALENAVATWKGTPSALVFSSGFQANITVIQALCAHSVILSDKLNHASLVDGCRLAVATGAKWQRYRHLDYADLEARLKKIRLTDAHTPIWIISDTLFSMDGDALDLNSWCELAERYNAFTYVDEAHAAGVYGPTHRSGLVEAANLHSPVDIHMGTFSKALGGFGAYVACSSVVRNYLINQARGFIYTTSLPPAVLAGNLASLQLLQRDASYTQRLEQNLQYFQQTLHGHPRLVALQVPVSSSPIIPFTLADNATALAWEKALYEEGFLVKAIRPPTVPQARLRVSLSAAHAPSAIAALVDALARRSI